MEAFVQMTGHVGGEVNYRNNTMPVADFRLASTPRVLRGGQWMDGETTWITVKAFKSLAEHALHSLRRGDPIIVIGRLRTSVWVRDGVTHERLELDASTIGHDLRRGVSRFRRPERATAPVADERPGGDSVTADQGEVDRVTAEQVEAEWGPADSGGGEEEQPTGAERAA